MRPTVSCNDIARLKKHKYKYRLATKLEIFTTPFLVAEAVAAELVGMILKAKSEDKKFRLVLSGGNTPYFLFSILTDQFYSTLNWSSVHIFWADERCVHPTHADSNYGMAFHNLIDKIEIPEQNIHRIKGEENPKVEAERYSGEISGFTETRNGLPYFDLILLGLGEDGHTASIFPESISLFKSEKVCEPTRHPVTMQKRITLTGPVINNAGKVIFMATGKKKAKVISEILDKTKPEKPYPASLVNTSNGNTEWYIDSEAASFIEGKSI